MNCHHCHSEWNSAVDLQFYSCPFCKKTILNQERASGLTEPKELIKYLVEIYGDDLYTSCKEDFSNLIWDLMNSDTITKKLIRRSISEDNLTQKLFICLQISDKSVDSRISQIKAQFAEDNRYSNEFADEIVDSFLYGLGYVHKKEVLNANTLATEEEYKKTNSRKKESNKEVEIVIDESEIDDIVNDDLFKELRAWRKKKAEEIEKPAFFVAHQRVLIAIASTRLSTITELKRIKGIGQSFIDKYGTDVLEIIKKHSNVKDLFSVCIRIGNLIISDRNVGAPEGGAALNYTNDENHADHKNSLFKGGSYTWDKAQDICPCGWRLPTGEELEVIADAMQFSDGKAFLEDR